MFHWPPDYFLTFVERQNRLIELRKNPLGAIEFYSNRPIEFIEHWCDTVDPRNASDKTKLTRMPFILFPRQKDLVHFLYQCYVLNIPGLIEKCRDYGATWVCCAFSVWLWRFHRGSAVGWGSRIQDLVDKLGDMSSIFEKMRAIIDGLPTELLPAGFDPAKHMTYMRILNPENGSTIIGETGDNIGRGGRTSIYFKDESAHYQRPEKIEAALGDNTNVQIDISSVNGPGNVFHRKREAGEVWQPGHLMTPGKTAIFLADWTDHPAKTQAWYDTRRERAIAEGLLHIFEQEVNRNYNASRDGVIIQSEWFRAAWDAHILLGIEDGGEDMAGFDPANEGGDKHGFARRRGVVLKEAKDWADGDPGYAARQVIAAIKKFPGIITQYDPIGVGAAVKSEINRLSADEELDTKIYRFAPWQANGEVLFKKSRVIEGDKDSPLHGDMFHNLKAQGWWMVANKFYYTWQVVESFKRNEPMDFDPEKIISVDTTTIPKDVLLQLEKELSQAVRKPGSSKFQVDKNPPGTRSPNIADAVIQIYWPSPIARQYQLDRWA